MTAKTRLVDAVKAVVDPVTGGILGVSSYGNLISAPVSRFSITGLPTVMAFGNSVSRQNQLGYAAAGKVMYNAQYWWALAFAGHPMEWVQTGATVQVGGSASSDMSQGIYGYGGATSSAILPFFGVTVGTYKPNYCFLQLMENDVVSIVAATMTRTQAKENYLSAVQQCLAQGTIPIFIGCLPSKSYTTAAHSAEYWALTGYVESLQSLYPGMIYVPVYDLYTDGVLTAPQPLTAGIYANYTDASVHPQAVAPLIGLRIADVLAQRNIKGFGGIPGPGDARFIGGNAFCSGTAGSVSVVTGTACDRLTIANNTTTSSIAGSSINREGRSCQQVTIASGTSTGLQNVFSMYTAAIAAGAGTFAVGDTVQAFAEITIENNSVNGAPAAFAGLRDFTLDLAQTGGTPSDVFWGFKASGDAFDTNSIPQGRKMLISTPLSVVPASTTAVRPFLFAYATKDAAAISGQYYVTKFAVVNWSKTN